MLSSNTGPMVGQCALYMYNIYHMVSQSWLNLETIYKCNKVSKQMQYFSRLILKKECPNNDTKISMNFRSENVLHVTRICSEGKCVFILIRLSYQSVKCSIARIFLHTIELCRNFNEVAVRSNTP